MVFLSPPCASFGGFSRLLGAFWRLFAPLAHFFSSAEFSCLKIAVRKRWRNDGGACVGVICGGVGVCYYKLTISLPFLCNSLLRYLMPCRVADIPPLHPRTLGQARGSPALRAFGAFCFSMGNGCFASLVGARDCSKGLFFGVSVGY